MSEKTVFVTTGATVVFQELIEIVLNRDFLEVLIKLRFTRLKIQYGIPADGEKVFRAQLNTLEVPVKQESNGHLLSRYKSIFIEGFAFSNDINSILLDSDLVISHAGTGSILDTLRLSRPLIVVTNPKLMDNHQNEIANELFASLHLLKSTPDTTEIIENVKKIDSVRLSPLPLPQISVISDILHAI